MKWIVRLYCLVRFGRVSEKTQAIDGGLPSEVEILSSKGQRVGYFAYGAYDPSLPFGETCDKYALRNGRRYNQ